VGQADAALEKKKLGCQGAATDPGMCVAVHGALRGNCSGQIARFAELLPGCQHAVTRATSSRSRCGFAGSAAGSLHTSRRASE